MNPMLFFIWEGEGMSWNRSKTTSEATPAHLILAIQNKFPPTTTALA